MFSHFGFAREILSDCRTQFMSQLTKVFLEEFGIKHIRTSPYHPATNGSCERFNYTLKSMLRAVAEDFSDSSDQTLPWIVFAYREIPVETLGFPPIELLYGRSVPGPLSLLKDSWLETPIASNLTSVVEFVLDMRERLRSSITHAQQHAKEQKIKAKFGTTKKLVVELSSRVKKFLLCYLYLIIRCKLNIVVRTRFLRNLVLLII